MKFDELFFERSCVVLWLVLFLDEFLFKFVVFVVMGLCDIKSLFVVDIFNEVFEFKDV